MNTKVKKIIIPLLLLAACIAILLGCFLPKKQFIGRITVATVHDIEDEHSASDLQHSRMVERILHLLSLRTGVEFAYLGESHDEHQLQADMILVHSPDAASLQGNTWIPLFSYSSAGETMEIVLIVKGEVDAHLMEATKAGASSIVPADVHSLSNEAALFGMENPVLTLILLMGVVITLLIICFCIYRKSKKVIRQKEASENTDAETGIGNLISFKQYFAQLQEQPYDPLLYMAYLNIDSDYLHAYHKQISFDDVLQYTAKALSFYPKEGETVARVTENAFVFTLHSANMQSACDQLQIIINRLNRYVSIRQTDNRPVFHAAVYQLNPKEVGCELLLMKLRRNCANISGSNQQIIPCDAHSVHDVQEEKESAESIQRGFARNEFKLYLQFSVNNSTDEITSAEALSRWAHPSLGLLLPGKYIETMKETGLICQLDYYMFEMVCRQLEEWNEGEMSLITLSCNFTRITISQEDFAERIQEIVQRYTFDHNRLILEITEDTMEASMENAMDNIRLCKKLGFQIALDDLGSGYTSLRNLCDYPIDTVKLDRDLLLKASKERGKKLFLSLIDLGHNMDLKVVCEGIETKEQREFIRSSPCDDIQGWYYSRPIPAEEGYDFFHSHSLKIAERKSEAASI